MFFYSIHFLKNLDFAAHTTQECYNPRMGTNINLENPERQACEKFSRPGRFAMKIGHYSN